MGKTLNLFDPYGIFEIESLSISLYSSLSVASDIAKVLFVQFTGTRIAQANNAMGTKIFSLHENQHKISMQLRTTLRMIFLSFLSNTTDIDIDRCNVVRENNIRRKFIFRKKNTELYKLSDSLMLSN